MSTQSIQLLSHQNQRLAVQLEEKRHTNKVLEDRVQNYDAKEEEYAQTLLCVNRLWNQLNSDITHLISVASAGPAHDAANGSGHVIVTGSKTGAGVCNHAGIKDPFLQKLLNRDLSSAKPFLDKQKALHAESTEVEDILLERANSTKAALASLLQIIQDTQASQDALSLQLASSCSSPSTLDAVSSQSHKSLAQDSASLRQQLSTAHATSRCTAEQLRLADDRQLEAKERIKSLQNELADREQELSTMQTKYFALTTAKDLQSETTAPPSSSNAGGGNTRPGACGAPQLSPGMAAPISGSGGSGSGWSGLQNGSAAATSTSQPQWPINGGIGTEAFKDELTDLQQLLTKRTAELDAEKEQHLKTQRELTDVIGRASDEAWVPTTRMYQLLHTQTVALQEQLSAKLRDCEAMCRERDAARREADMRSQCSQSEALARSQLNASEKAYRELQFAKSDADRLRQEFELLLAHERSLTGSPKTVSELKLMTSTLQQEVEVLQKHMQANKVTHARVEAAAQQCLESRSLLLTRESEMQRLQDRVRRTESKLTASFSSEAVLTSRVGDLTAFVEVLIHLCDDPREVLEVRASEASLRAELQAVRAQLQGHPFQARVRELEAAVRSAGEQTELATLEGDALRVELGCSRSVAAELVTQLAAARGECELYINEVGTTGAAYEEMQDQNTRLLQQLTEHDETNHHLMAERIKLTQQVASLTESLEATRAECDRCRLDLAALGALRDGLDRDVARLAGDLSQANDTIRSHTSRLDTATAELRKREEAVQTAQVQVSSAAKQAADRLTATDEMSDKLLKERTKRQRAEEDSKSLNSKLDRLRRASVSTPSNSGPSIREQEDEVKAMRQLLTCNICHDRQKNVIITKCCHVFCDKCVKRTLESRNRKCPGCQGAFSAGDVKQFFFT